MTRFAAGDLTFDVDAGNNTSELVTFENLSASPEGTIDLKIAVSPDGNARFACLNGLILEVLDNNSAYWGPCRVIDRMYVNTSGWLGWLMSGAAPWVYCYNIEGWLCIDAATIGHAGSWVYIPR